MKCPCGKQVWPWHKLSKDDIPHIPFHEKCFKTVIDYYDAYFWIEAYILFPWDNQLELYDSADKYWYMCIDLFKKGKISV